MAASTSRHVEPQERLDRTRLVPTTRKAFETDPAGVETSGAVGP